MALDRREFVSPRVFNACRSKGVDAITLLDDRIIAAFKRLRVKYPDIYCNNWHVGGIFKQSGFRDDVKTGAEFSQHRYGRGLDIHTSKSSLQAIYSDIVRNRHQWPEITCVEDIKITKGWIHIDCRFVPDKFLIVRG